ncbi:hypothetical protein LNP25_16225 [Klebsiella variicola subsp. variicola]|nr:hypothetical protein [Klebsiella variicola subsp. variicola]
MLFSHHFAAIAGAGPLVGPGARRADGLPAGDDLDPRRRGASPARPGLYGAVCFEPSRWPLSLANWLKRRWGQPLASWRWWPAL